MYVKSKHRVWEILTLHQNLMVITQPLSSFQQRGIFNTIMYYLGEDLHNFSNFPINWLK